MQLARTVYVTDRRTAATTKVPAGTPWTPELGRAIVRAGAWTATPDPPGVDVDVEDDADVDDGEDPGVPARSGPGSGRDAWAAYATSRGVQIPDTASRDDIIDYLTGRGIVTAAD